MFSSFSPVLLTSFPGVFPDEERAADVRTRGAVVEHPSLSRRSPNGLWEYRMLVRSKRYRVACSVAWAFRVG